MKLTDVVIDAARTLGKTMILTEVMPVYEYAEGKRTDNVTAYRYVVVLPERCYEKISVKISGSQKMEVSSEFNLVGFDNLSLYLYWTNGTYAVGALADNIHVVEAKH